MAANDFAYASNYNPSDVAVKNTSATVAIAAGDVVTLDASFPVSETQPDPGVIQATTENMPYGVAMEAIAIGKVGRARRNGRVACKVSGAVATVGTVVGASTVGKVIAASAAKPYLGTSLTAGATDGDKILVELSIGTST